MKKYESKRTRKRCPLRIFMIREHGGGKLDSVSSERAPKGLRKGFTTAGKTETAPMAPIRNSLSVSSL